MVYCYSLASKLVMVELQGGSTLVVYRFRFRISWALEKRLYGGHFRANSGHFENAAPALMYRERERERVCVCLCDLEE